MHLQLHYTLELKVIQLRLLHCSISGVSIHVMRHSWKKLYTVCMNLVLAIDHVWSKVKCSIKSRHAIRRHFLQKKVC